MGLEKLFCFDDEFFDRRRPAPFCQQTNLVKFSSPKLKLVLQLPARNFKEIVKIKCDNHKILDNFCLIKNYSEECPRHHTGQAGRDFSDNNKIKSTIYLCFYWCMNSTRRKFLSSLSKSMYSFVWFRRKNRLKCSWSKKKDF